MPLDNNDIAVCCPHTTVEQAHMPGVQTFCLHIDYVKGVQEFLVCCPACAEALSDHFMIDFAVEFIVEAARQDDAVAQQLIERVGEASARRWLKR